MIVIYTGGRLQVTGNTGMYDNYNSNKTSVCLIRSQTTLHYTNQTTGSRKTTPQYSVFSYVALIVFVGGVS